MQHKSTKQPEHVGQLQAENAALSAQLAILTKRMQALEKMLTYQKTNITVHFGLGNVFWFSR